MYLPFGYFVPRDEYFWRRSWCWIRCRGFLDKLFGKPNNPPFTLCCAASWILQANSSVINFRMPVWWVSPVVLFPYYLVKQIICVVICAACSRVLTKVDNYWNNIGESRAVCVIPWDYACKSFLFFIYYLVCQIILLSYLRIGGMLDQGDKKSLLIFFEVYRIIMAKDPGIQ